jgi:hypothetical protein
MFAAKENRWGNLFFLLLFHEQIKRYNIFRIEPSIEHRLIFVAIGFTSFWEEPVPTRLRRVLTNLTRVEGEALKITKRIVLDKVRTGFVANPVAWILFGLLALAQCRSYLTGRDLQTVCELTGPHNVSFENPVTERQQLDTICVRHEPAD